MSDHGAGRGSGWKAAQGGMNVLSETVKFGKLLNRVRNDGKVYLNYKDLKQCMGETMLFKEKLKREIRYVDTFFKREEEDTYRTMQQDPELIDSLVVALQRFVVINCFAVIKIMQKHDKWHNGEHTCRSEILEHLQSTGFYNAFQRSQVFLTTAVSPDPTENYTCVGCRRDAYYVCSMSSCYHHLCWDCTIRMEERNLTHCPACGEVLVLTSSVILAEDVLGVVPRAIPRRERRKGRRGKNREDDQQQVQQPPPPQAPAPEDFTNILAESEDEKNAQRSIRYYCKDCSMVLNSFRQAQIHMNGQRHLDQVQRLRERCTREGVPYEPTGLVNCDASTKIEGAPKPRRSRGLRNRLRGDKGDKPEGVVGEGLQADVYQQQPSQPPPQPQSQQQQHPMQQHPMQQHHQFAPAQHGMSAAVHGMILEGGRDGSPLTPRNLAMYGFERHGSCTSLPDLYEHQQQPAANMGITMTPGQGGMRKATKLHGSSASLTSMDTLSFHDPLVSSGYNPYPLSDQMLQLQIDPKPAGASGPHIGFDDVINNAGRVPYVLTPFNFPYVQDKPNPSSAPGPYNPPYAAAAMPAPNAHNSSAAAPAHFQQTHAFQSERVNTVLRQSIELVMSQKDTGSALQTIKTVLTEKNGCSSLVEEIFKGIFNGENTMDYAILCKMLVDSKEPEVSLSIYEFTHYLLLKCRVTVTVPIEPVTTTYDMPQEQVDSMEEMDLRQRFRRTAAIKFSADLFSKDIMPEALVHVCIQTMLFGRTVSGEDTPDAPEIDEDSLATACRILVTVGMKIKKDSFNRYLTILEKALPSLTSSRIKRKVKQLLEQFATKPEEAEADAEAEA
ncbi:hypothetical protein DIPPA_03413 [Diplonema papillatum]|nr:hypothetical protein DIPPA_03413 [Diplonema papillatum]|eukprot:gene10856-16705_t